MPNMAGPPEEIVTLIEKFRNDEAHYRSTNYNETQCRIDFINPMFELLGWDMNNRAGYAEAYRDVIHEDAIKIGGATKAPDYCFRIGGTRKFFVEAKKPGRNLKNDAEPAFQLRRYAWSAKLPLSILTDFEEFAVYDCRRQPVKDDKPSTARTFYCTFDEYPDKWDEIAGIFSRESLLKGSFDKYAVSARKKRGTAEVDTAFLEEIADWRKSVAKNVALRNPQVSQRELNFAVQRTIDRIIFLRICEDRGIEPYGRLQSLQNGSAVYARLCEFFRSADDKYNSGIFHFRKEKNRHESPDELTLSLEIDDKVLKDILKRLYYPESPYEFSVLSADILGQVYEQFLGEVIVLKGRQAKVEPKPEVRKAGGVYYTPTYIVDYIVRHTVGRLLGDEPDTIAAASEPAARGDRTTAPPSKTPKDAAKLRILDPACGSGSFLIAAYQYLLEWHLRWYVADDPEKHATGKKAEVFRGKGGAWRLTTAERKRILLNNIFGVDIDPQAVEVTKLSLLLKVLEGESAESVSAQWKLFHERALPDLGDNIKCGNSLIGPDFYANKQLSLIDEEERLRVNVFDWKAEFSEIIKSGGFDAVIGNPPYAYRNATEESLRPYYLEHYSCAEGNYDTYKFFLERSTCLLRTSGRLGMIVSATFLIQPSFTRLRRVLLDAYRFEILAPLGPRVFLGATVDTAVIVASRHDSCETSEVSIISPESPEELPHAPRFSVPQSRFAANENHVFDYRLSPLAFEMVNRLLRDFPSIETEFEFGVGINTGYIKSELCSDHRVDSRYHRMVPGDGLSRYGPARTKGWIMYDAAFVKSRGKLGRTLPAKRLMDEPKILVVRTRNLSIPRRIIATIDRTKAYNLNRLSNIIAKEGSSLESLLGILNSRLFNWLFSTRYFDYEIKPVYLRQAPLATRSDKALSALVTKVLSLTQLLLEQKTAHEKTTLQRQIDAIDHQIDQLVYQLYGLTDEEIRIVEESTKS
ncbi:MAG: hypothetical protein B6D36_02450 [Planctomycetes bacterium UTPLA1]|nr:MAG: hypothetical protein B6D36_02450 [Planctomycetes bacterium UTPLA1]